MPDPGSESAELKEARLIEKSKDNPLVTQKTLAADLYKLGVRAGITLIVHSSLSSLGWVCGGAASAVLALEEVLGEEGTLVMPTHTTDLSDAASWRHPPVPEKWWQQIRDETPAYKKDLTPTRQMGAIPECFRKQDGTLRSNHPLVSFAARGRDAELVVGSHGLDYSLGEGSPLARVYDLNGWVLLLGVGHSNNTSIHLAEYRATYPAKKKVRSGAPILLNGARQWVWFDDINFDDSDFEKIGTDFATDAGPVTKGRVALADALLVPQRQLVDYSLCWIERNRV